MTQWQDIACAPRDGTPILGWCNHEADPYSHGNTLTLYAAHAEGLSHVENGPHVIVWGGSWCDTGEYGAVEAELPNWWFQFGSEFDVAANPTHWAPIPCAPEISA